MKKLILILLLSLGFIGTGFAGEIYNNIKKLKKERVCEGCNLQGANLSNAFLMIANLREANLREANLSGANLNGANLSGANLSRANLREVKLARADLTGADLAGADLTGAYLDGTNLSGANLSGVNLTGASLVGTNLPSNIEEKRTVTEREQDQISLELEVSRLWEEEKLKPRHEIRKEIKAKIKDGGYKSFRLMKLDEPRKIEEEKRKKEEAKRKIEEEKKIAANIKAVEKKIDGSLTILKNHLEKLPDLELDYLKVEADELIREVEGNTNSDLVVLKSLNQSLRDMNSSVELKIKSEESKQRILSLKDYPGFKDLKPGLHYDDLTEFCHLRKGYWVRCYGIDNIKFYGKFKNDVLYELILDMGPIVNSSGFLSVFGENDSNIFIKMRNTFDKKYSRDFGYSERDRQFFNESEKSRLYEVYSKGQVVLEINRKEKDWSSDLWLYIHYLDPSKAETFLKENRPVRASEDDF